MKITGRLQQKLETFKIPEGISSKTGKKKIERVFLDKGELEIAGDLNEIIMSALRNTDYLIVICSPESYESPWVKKEIEYFLRFKSRNEILTVLTEGEPDQVIPDILRYNETVSADGTVVRIPAEPLSCDYRLPLKEAERVELPRLVAAIIGCRYDDLIQRHKHYRQKIITRIAAGATAAMTLLSGYMMWNNHRLTVSYNNTLIEQSRSLILQSEQALEQGNRIDAVKYSLEALPSAEKKRPLLYEAVLSLSKSLNMYVSPDNPLESAVRQYKLSVGGEVFDKERVSFFDIYEYNGSEYLVAVYSSGILGIWDARTGQQIYTEITDRLYFAGSDIYSIAADDRGHLLYTTDSTVTCVDLSNGTEIWNNDLSGGFSISYEGAACEGSTLWVTGATDDLRYILKINSETGDVISRYGTEYYPDLICPSPDGRSAVCRITKTDSDNPMAVEYESMMLLGPGDSDNKEIGRMPHITSLSFKDKDHILAAGLNDNKDTDYDLGKTITYLTSSYIGHMSLTEEKTCIISCFDTDSGSELWRNEITGMFNAYPEISDDGSPEAPDGQIAVTIGKRLICFDENGEQKSSKEFGNPVMAYYRKPDNDMLFAVLVDGSRGSFSPGTGELYCVYDIFRGPVTGAISDDDSVFAVCSVFSKGIASSRIIEYGFSGHDEKWEYYDYPEKGETELVDADETRIASFNDSIAEIRNVDLEKRNSRNGYSNIEILLRDAETGRPDEKEIIIEAPERGKIKYAGSDEDEEKLYFIEYYDDSSAVITYDIKSGTLYEKAINYDRQENDFSLSDADIITADMVGKKLVLLTIGEKSGYDANILSIVSIDPESGDGGISEILETEWDMFDYSFGGKTVRSAFIDTYGSSVWVVDGGRYTEYDVENGKEKTSFSTDDVTPFAVTADHNGNLFAVEEKEKENTLHVYNRKTGKEIAASDLWNMEVYSKDLRFDILADGNIILYLRGIGERAVILDPLTYEKRADIIGFKGINVRTGDIIISSENKLGHVPYRSLDEMIIEGIAVTGE